MTARVEADGLVTVSMGAPVFEPALIPFAAEGIADTYVLLVDDEALTINAVSMGNPHAVLQVADVSTATVSEIGPLIEHHSAFPNRTNVEFVTPLGRDRIRQRTWERGVGETLACGSGACAVAVVAMLRGAVDDEVTIELRGGELEISWGGSGAPVFMTGPAAEVFTGEFPIREE